MGIRDINILAIFLTLVFIFVLPPVFSTQRSPQKPLTQHIQSGNQFLDEDQPQHAIDQFNLALKISSKDISAISGKAEAFEMQENWDKAAELYKTLNGLKPFDYALLTRWNSALEKSGDKATQREVLRALFQLNPNDPNIAICLLKALESDSNQSTQKERVFILEKINTFPGTAEFLSEKLGAEQLVELTESIQRKGRKDLRRDSLWKTIDAVTKWKPVVFDTLPFQQKLNGMILRYPEEDKLKEAQAILYYVQQQYDYARPLVKHLADDNINANRLRGNLYFLNEQFQSAALHLDKIPRALMSQTDWERLCDSYLSCNQKQKAHVEYQNLIKQYPDSRPAQTYLIYKDETPK